MVLGKGWYIRQYNKVLMELVTVVEVARLQANKLAKTKPEPMWSLQVGQSAQGKNYPASIPSFLDFTYDGDRSGPERSLRYPEVICESKIWPDIILHSWLTKQVE